MSRSFGDILHRDLLFFVLALILLLIVVLRLAVESAVGRDSDYRAAALGTALVDSVLNMAVAMQAAFFFTNNTKKYGVVLFYLILTLYTGLFVWNLLPV